MTLSAQAQCAMCRAILASEAGQTTAKGVNDGIVYLMLIPYILMGGLALVAYRYVKKVSKKKTFKIEEFLETYIQSD